MSDSFNSTQFTPRPFSEIEEEIILDEYTMSNLREMLMKNKEIFQTIETQYPKYAAQLKIGFRAELLVEKGICPNIDEAEKLVKDMRSHRTSLKFCQDTADKYVSQLTDSEFQGFHVSVS